MRNQIIETTLSTYRNQQGNKYSLSFVREKPFEVIGEKSLAKYLLQKILHAAEMDSGKTIKKIPLGEAHEIFGRKKMTHQEAQDASKRIMSLFLHIDIIENDTETDWASILIIQGCHLENKTLVIHPNPILCEHIAELRRLELCLKLQNH